MTKLKQYIKDLAEGFTGEREIEPWQAALEHRVNRGELRILYAAYALLRGKTYHDVENHYPEENHPLNQFNDTINDIVEKYQEQFVRLDRETA